jgi:hypothetical protein
MELSFSVYSFLDSSSASETYPNKMHRKKASNPSGPVSTFLQGK